MAKELVEKILAHSHEAIFTLDTRGTISSWNRGAEHLYGWTEVEAVGRSSAMLDWGSANAMPEGTGEVVLHQRHKDGRELRVALRIAPLEKAGERLVCAVDTTRLCRLEADLSLSRESLETGRRELQRTAKRLLQAQEDLRRRFARELHDDLNQRLEALALELEVVRRTLPRERPEEERLRLLGNHVAEMSGEVRRLARELHPTVLERFGLAEALRSHCAELERLHGLEIRLALRGEDDSLPPETAIGLFRIAQEALANAARHAAARRIGIELLHGKGEIRLAVADDGAGFDPDGARRGGGLGLTSLAERAALLGGHCRIDSAPGAGTEIEVVIPLSEPAADAAEETGSGERQLGPYRLLEALGNGTTSTVFLAEEPPPLARRVALKLHRSPLPGRRETLRFKAEQQALARLDHPAIAKVYEARTTEEGDLYIAMEYVPGLPITEHCDRYQSPLGDRLELFAQVCDGVRHAHQKGILHRDLKPSNLLINEEQGRATPKIIDFGAARGLDRPLAAGTVWTVEDLVGTPAYLAPEMLSGAAGDTRSDVYSLGVVLYELLTGSLPLMPGPGGLAAFVEEVRRGAFPPPSRRLALGSGELAAHQRGFRGRPALARAVAGALDRITAKALAPDPEQRYETVAELAADVRRHLAGEPVRAGPAGRLYLLEKFVRRHRVEVALAALLVMALTAATVFATLAAQRAVREAAVAAKTTDFLAGLFETADPLASSGAPATVHDLLARGAERLEAFTEQPLVKARLLQTLGRVERELDAHATARPLLEEALEIRRQRLGRDHLEVAESLIELGHLDRLQGRFDDADQRLRRALAIRERAHGTGHPAYAEVLKHLGTTAASRGRWEEAQAFLERAATIHDTHRAGNAAELGAILNNLGGILLYQGRPEAAERFLRRAMELRQKSFGESHPATAANLEGLALTLKDQGRLDEAQELLERALSIWETALGPEHPNVGRALANIAVILTNRGDDAAAEEAFWRSLAIRETALGPGHPDLAYPLKGLAAILHRRGELGAAEPLYRRAVELLRLAMEPDHPELVEALSGYAALLRELGRGEEAAALLEEGESR